MAHAYCEHVKNGNTFRVKGDIWIKLANVSVPEREELDGNRGKRILESRILHKYVVYNPVAKERKVIVADVWVENNSVNEYMRLQGYT